MTLGWMQRPEFRKAARCAVENVANHVLLDLRKLSKYSGKAVNKQLQKMRERSSRVRSQPFLRVRAPRQAQARGALRF